MSHLPASSRLLALTASAAMLLGTHPASAQQPAAPVDSPPITVPVLVTSSPPPPPVRPAPSPPPVSIPPPAPPPPPPAASPVVTIVSPADQLATALSDRDLNKVTALLSADVSLAKTPSSDGTPPLVSALKNFWGDDNASKQILQMLLDDGSDINAADRSGTTPLQSLLARGNGNQSSNTLLLLLDKGADIKAKNAEGKDALLLAVGSGDIGSAKLLLSRGADINSRDMLGDTPLHLAITGQNPDMIDTLLNAGANVNVRNNRGEMPIHLAMRLTELQPPDLVPSHFPPPFGQGVRQDKRRGNPLLVPQLLDRGAQINARDQSGMTPLLFSLLNCDKINYAVLMQRHAAMDTLTMVFNAAATDDTAALARLLKALPDIKDLRAPTGATALHVAALWNAPDAVRLLLHSGLEVSARDATQETPLHYACWLPQNTPMVGLLLDSGANINAEDVFGDTPLHLTIHSHSPALLRVLLARKALPDLPNATGETPLALAVAQGDVDIAAALIAAGANVNTHSRYAGNFLLTAIQTRSAPMVTLLLASGANVNYVADERGGDSPLVEAVQNDNREIVQLLLDKGADVNYKTRWGQSILSMARSYNNSGVADLLKQHGAK